MSRLLSVLALGVAVCFCLGTTGCTNTKKSGATTKTGMTSDKMETGSKMDTGTHSKSESSSKSESGTTTKTEPTGKTEKTEKTEKKGARLSLPLFDDFLAASTTVISGEQYARRGGCQGARPAHNRRSRGVRVGCC